MTAVNAAKEAALNQDGLKSILDYSPVTGLFVRRYRPGKGYGGAGKIVGIPHHTGYLFVWIGKHQYSLHRLAWLWMAGAWPTDQIDHINCDKADNRWNNLRPATQIENSRNSKIQRNNTSGYTGVSFNKALRKWHAYIRLPSKRIHLGFFLTREEAARCRQAGETVAFGAFARSSQNHMESVS